MATFMLNDASVVINSVNLSSKGTSLSITTDVNILEDTHFGATWEGKIPGMKSWSATADFSQDFASGSVDATLWAAHGTAVTVTFKPTSGTVSTTNPSFSGTAIVSYGGPISNSVGDKATASVTLTGSGALTRATS